MAHDKLKVSLSVKTPDGKVQKLADDINNLSPEGRAVAVAAIDALNVPAPERNDIFLMANNLVGELEEYELQLFLINKNYVLYSLNTGETVKERLRRLFLDQFIEDVLTAAENGAQVLDYAATLKNDGNIAWLPVDKTRRVDSVVRWIEEHGVDIERFSEDEHDLKRQKGIVARFTKKGSKPFMIVKQFAGGAAVKRDRDFMLQGDKVATFREDAAFKIDATSQMLIVENDIFVLQQGKFEALFDTKPHQLAVAQRNGKYIDQKFKLSMPLVVQEIAMLAETNKSTLKQLAEIDPERMDQEQVEEAMDQYGVELMLDDNGAIILMDATDVKKFLDILADNYVQGITGTNYLAKNKKELEE